MINKDLFAGYFFIQKTQYMVHLVDIEKTKRNCLILEVLTSPGIGNNALIDAPGSNQANSGAPTEGHTVKIYELPLPDTFASIIDGWYTENAETESV